MKYLENELLYDTETAILIGSKHKFCEYYDFYRTKNGRYFCVYSNIIDALVFSDYIFFTNEKHVKELMFSLIPNVAYQVYGEVKEA